MLAKVLTSAVVGLDGGLVEIPCSGALRYPGTGQAYILPGVVAP